MEKKPESSSVLVWGRSFSSRNSLLTRPLTLQVPFCIKEISCSDDHCLFLTPAGQVFSQGLNARGCLGLAAPAAHFAAKPELVTALAEEVVTTVTCGQEHSFCLTDAGLLYAWGAGEYGVLGLGHTEDESRPMAVRLPGGKALSISTGARHTLVLGDSGRGTVVWACGLNAAGQLGLGQINAVSTLTEVKLIDEAEQVSCGVSHSMLLTSRRQVYAMGNNSLGQLGLGHSRNCIYPTRVSGFPAPVVKVAAGSHSAALTETGDMFVWGTGPFGTFLTPTKLNPPSLELSDIALGTHFGIAEDIEGNLWTWGSNTSGQLGLGDFKPRPKLTRSLLQLTTVQLLRIGGASVLAVQEESDEQQDLPVSSLSPNSPQYTSPAPLPAEAEVSRLRKTVESLEAELRTSYRRFTHTYRSVPYVDPHFFAHELQSELADSLRLNDDLTRNYERLRVSHETAEREKVLLAKELDARDRAAETLRLKYVRLKDAHAKLKMQNAYLVRNVREEQSAKDRLKADLRSLEAALDAAQKSQSDVSALKETAKAFERENAALRKDMAAITAECRALEKKLIGILQENDSLKSDLLRSVDWKRRGKHKEEAKEERKAPRKSSGLEPIEETEGSSPPQSSGKRYSDVYQSPSDFAPFTDTFNPPQDLKEPDETELKSPDELPPAQTAISSSSLRNSLSESTWKTKELRRSQTGMEQRRKLMERKLMSRDSEGEE